MMTGKKFWMAGAAVLALTASATAAVSAKQDSAGNTTKPMTASQIQLAQATAVQVAQNTYGQDSTASGDLSSRVKALEDALAAQQDRATSDRTRLSTIEQAYATASWTFDNGRPTLTTGDGRFSMAVRLRFQSDFAGFQQDTTHPTGFAGPTDLSSGDVIRRAYFGVEGKVYNDFWYEFRMNGGGTNGGLNTTCTVTPPTATTTLTPAIAGTTAATTVVGGTACAVGGVASGGEGDPLVNKAVITYTGIPNLHISVGVIEPSFMMEGTTSSKDLTWLERPEIENIAADSFGAGDSRRGVEIGWSKTDALWAGDNVAFDVAFTGGKTGSLATHGNGGDENTQLLGRAADRFWSDGFSNLQAGISVAKAIYTGNGAGGGSQSLNFQERPEIRVDGTRLVSTGGIAAKSGGMYAFDLEGNFQNFYLEGEYAHFEADRQCGAISSKLVPGCVTSTSVLDHPGFSGWTIGGSWILTGETKTYSPSGLAETQAGFGAPVPSRPFSLAGGSWGTWELVARYSDTDLNWHKTQADSTTQLAGILGGEQRILDLGVNWYINRNVRLMIDDNIVTVKRGTLAAPTNQNQNLNIIGARLQFAN